MLAACRPHLDKLAVLAPAFRRGADRLRAKVVRWAQFGASVEELLLIAKYINAKQYARKEAKTWQRKPPRRSSPTKRRT
jgi:hypothetical protein